MKKQGQDDHLRQFSDNYDEKVAREKTYLLKLKFDNTDRKMKRIIKRIFISIVMHPNLLHFRQKISFKSALEILTPVSRHLRIALRLNHVNFLFLDYH